MLLCNWCLLDILGHENPKLNRLTMNSNPPYQVQSTRQEGVKVVFSAIDLKLSLHESQGSYKRGVLDLVASLVKIYIMWVLMMIKGIVKANVRIRMVAIKELAGQQ
ncbi:hypothetical protein QVD17_24481 [Tagetes erecta]|uniref:Uncharacterized protein n=1 Tax=Tagetes erecta TaxID=13708 RepID=A0AAD8KF50_TARER|nr:hypothetical protein QVD17_24481 [Tagetes erecta]